MRTTLSLLAVLFLLALPAAASASYLGPPYTTNDGVWEATWYWYPNCRPSSLLEYGYIDSNPAPYGKWRNFMDVCQNPRWPPACAADPARWWQSWTGRWYYLACGHEGRNFDSWCWNGNGNIRVRDLYHGWEMVTSVPCVKWY